MPAPPILRLGTRRSPLAMAQANEARNRLCAAHDWDLERVELVPVIASGDKIQDRPLAEIGGKALWTKELDALLADGQIDASVHSMKDVETIRPDAFVIAAVLPRADRRDRLLGAASVGELPPGAVIGTSAPRRAAQLRHQRPDCRVVPIRGNVATRLAKLAAGDVDSTFLAAAGLDRLGEHGIGRALECADWLPAPAQGAIGLECRSNDENTRRLLYAIDDTRSHAEILAERAFLEGLGGTCHSPIAALTTWNGNNLTLTGSLFSPDGAERTDGSVTLEGDARQAAMAFARNLLSRSSRLITDHFESME